MPSMSITYRTPNGDCGSIADSSPHRHRLFRREIHGTCLPVHLLFYIDLFCFLIIAKKNYQVSSIFPYWKRIRKSLLKICFPFVLPPVLYLVVLSFSAHNQQEADSPQYFRLFRHRSFCAVGILLYRPRLFRRYLF